MRIQSNIHTGAHLNVRRLGRATRTTSARFNTFYSTVSPFYPLYIPDYNYVLNSQFHMSTKRLISVEKGYFLASIYPYFGVGPRSLART
jgi:uncharacterized protein (DUF1015 family)